MKNILLIIFLFFFAACTSFSEAGKVLRNEKTNSSDEFLIQKREPLTVPPSGAELPSPDTLDKQESAEKKNIEQILNTKKDKKNKTLKNSTNEESILSQINK